MPRSVGSGLMTRSIRRDLGRPRGVGDGSSSAVRGYLRRALAGVLDRASAKAGGRDYYRGLGPNLRPSVRNGAYQGASQEVSKPTNAMIEHLDSLVKPYRFSFFFELAFRFSRWRGQLGIDDSIKPGTRARH